MIKFRILALFIFLVVSDPVFCASSPTVRNRFSGRGTPPLSDCLVGGDDDWERISHASEGNVDVDLASSLGVDDGEELRGPSNVEAGGWAFVGSADGQDGEDLFCDTVEEDFRRAMALFFSEEDPEKAVECSDGDGEKLCESLRSLDFYVQEARGVAGNIHRTHFYDGSNWIWFNLIGGFKKGSLLKKLDRISVDILEREETLQENFTLSGFNLAKDLALSIIREVPALLASQNTDVRTWILDGLLGSSEKTLEGDA